MQPWSQEEVERYRRQFSLNDVGEAGQYKLKMSSVLVVGAGGLGCPVLQYLAAAGVGTLGVIDADNVELSNLHRQLLFSTEDVGQPKASKAQEHLHRLNPHIQLKVFTERLTHENVEKMLSPFDIVVDGTDNFASKYLINDACRLFNKPLVTAAVQEFSGQVSLFSGAQGPCYRCAFPAPTPLELAPSCADAGILGVTPGLAGLLQAAEVIKWILGTGDSLQDKLLLFDLSKMQQQLLSLNRDPECILCGDHPTIHSIKASQEWINKNVIECTVPQEDARNVSVQSIYPQWQQGQCTIIDVRSHEEFAAGSVAGAKNVSLQKLHDPDVIAELRHLSRTQQLIVMCQRGGRSQRAVQILGHNNVVSKSLLGGYDAWLRHASQA